MTSQHSLVAYWAIILLGRLGPDAVSGEGILANVLTNSSDPGIREQAAWALGKIGVTTDTAIAALKHAQDGGTARLVRLAQEALQRARADPSDGTFSGEIDQNKLTAKQEA